VTKLPMKLLGSLFNLRKSLVISTYEREARPIGDQLGLTGPITSLLLEPLARSRAPLRRDRRVGGETAGRPGSRNRFTVGQRRSRPKFFGRLYARRRLVFGEVQQALDAAINGQPGFGRRRR
jgi:hypothetical protein